MKFKFKNKSTYKWTRITYFYIRAGVLKNYKTKRRISKRATFFVIGNFCILVFFFLLRRYNIISEQLFCNIKSSSICDVVDVCMSCYCLIRWFHLLADGAFASTMPTLSSWTMIKVIALGWFIVLVKRQQIIFRYIWTVNEHAPWHSVNI